MYRQILSDYDTSVESVKNKVIAHTKQIYRKEMLLLCSVNEHEVHMKSNTDSDTRGSGEEGGVSSTMTDYCAQVSLQTKPS